MCYKQTSSKMSQTPRPPFRRILPIGEVIRPRLPRWITSTPRVNLNINWSKFAELSNGDAPLQPGSSEDIGFEA
ncbi:hypothetical protein HUJ05_010782 [Dendroctonus ponderosae]|nr:hypothetical protein HUJ05_010782 [Dendroctonus ponderosae]